MLMRKRERERDFERANQEQTDASQRADTELTNIENKTSDVLNTLALGAMVPAGAVTLATENSQRSLVDFQK
jgi:hypothetical protein